MRLTIIRGVSVYEIERESQDGPYKMLHLVLDVRRQNPTRERRAPGAAFPVAVTDAYTEVARSIFTGPEIVVTDAILDQTDLQASLAKIRARRRKYYPDEE